MLKITRQLAFERFSAMPVALQDALLSETSAFTVKQAAQRTNLPDYKVPVLNVVVGDVIMGFLHFEDAAREISLDLGIPIELANEIWNDLDKRLLAPLKPEIEKLYAPPTASGAAPLRIFTEIHKPSAPVSSSVKISSPPPASLPTGFPAQQNFDRASINIPKSPLISIPTPPPPPSPPSASQGGGSSASTISLRTPQSIQPPTYIPSKPGQGMPPPVMIHEELRTQTIKQPPPFNLGSADQKLKDVKIDLPEPHRPAQIEIGGQDGAGRATNPSTPLRTNQGTEPKIVNYGDRLRDVRKGTPPIPPPPPAVRLDKPIPPPPPPPREPQTAQPITKPASGSFDSAQDKQGKEQKKEGMIDLSLIGKSDETDSRLSVTLKESPRTEEVFHKDAVAKKEVPPPPAPTVPPPSTPQPQPTRPGTPRPGETIIDLRNMREVPKPPQPPQVPLQ